MHGLKGRLDMAEKRIRTGIKVKEIIQNKAQKDTGKETWSKMLNTGKISKCIELESQKEEREWVRSVI